MTFEEWLKENTWADDLRFGANLLLKAAWDFQRSRIDKLEAELKEARVLLKTYADTRNYRSITFRGETEKFYPGPELARQFLEKYK